MALIGPGGKLATANPALCDLLVYSPQELATRTLPELADPEDGFSSGIDIEALLIGHRDRMAVDAQLVTADGRSIWVSVSAVVLDSGEARRPDSAGERPAAGRRQPDAGLEPDAAAGGVLVQIQDISEQRRREEHLRHLAEHDALTGLPNRRTFDERLAAHLSMCRRYGSSGALLLADLDDLKLVNDALGHAGGDALLRGLAQLLSGRLRESDLVGRLGGDEFGVLLPQADPEGAQTVATELVEGVRAQSRSWLPLGEWSLTVSVGIAVIDDAVDGAADLISRADRAMYEAKRRGRDGWAIWSGVRP